MSPDGLRLLFVGPGRIGLSLGYALTQADAIAALTYAGRRPAPPAHPLFTQGTASYTYGIGAPPPGTEAVFLSVPDDTVHDVAQELAARSEAPPGCAAFHVSGSMSTDALAPLHERGYSVGYMNPLQIVSNPVTGADLLPGAFFSISGEPRARATAQRILSALGSHGLAVPATQRPLYDAAAVLGSSYVALLIDAVRDLLVQAGVPWDEAGPALRQLVLGALEGLTGPEGRPATGPIARGDVETIRLHMRSLAPRERALYAALGAAALESDAVGLDAGTVRELAELFEGER